MRRRTIILAALTLFAIQQSALAQATSKSGLLGVSGGLVVNLPAALGPEECPPMSGVQVAGAVGRRFGKTAVLLEGSLTTADGGCRTVVPVGTNQTDVEVIMRAQKPGYPLKTLAVYLRRDVASISTSARLDAFLGGGLLIGKDMAFAQLGVGTLIGRHDPKLRIDVRYTRYSIPQYTTTRTYENFTVVDEQRSDGPNAVGQPIEIRVGIETGF